MCFRENENCCFKKCRTNFLAQLCCTRVLNIKLHRNGKLHSLLVRPLPKIRIIPKKASNKSFSASNFGLSDKKVHEGICLSLLRGGARGLERWNDLNIKLHRKGKMHSLFSTISPFELSSSPPGGDRHVPSRTFLSEIRCQKTFIWSFFRNNAYFWQRSAQKCMQFFITVHLMFQLNTGDNHVESSHD